MRIESSTCSVEVMPTGDGVVLQVDEQYSYAPGMASIQLDREQAVKLAHAILEQVDG